MARLLLPEHSTAINLTADTRSNSSHYAITAKYGMPPANILSSHIDPQIYYYFSDYRYLVYVDRKHHVIRLSLHRVGLVYEVIFTPANKIVRLET